MAVYSTPEDHATNAPETWEVRKGAERVWQLVDRQGTVLDARKTRREAVELLTSGFVFDLYQREGRWYAGEKISGWKPWAQVKAERERTAEWRRRKAALLATDPDALEWARETLGRRATGMEVVELAETRAEHARGTNENT